MMNRSNPNRNEHAGWRHEQGTVEIMDMPLFPLNVVLFPGMVLPLHIFEDRYREMINHCIETKSPFGVVLIANGTRAGIAVKPHAVGTAAHIRRVQKMPDGRMSIITVGKQRFRIEEVDHSKSYLTATVRHMPVVNGATRQAQQLTEEVRPMILEYVELIAKASQSEVKLTNLPTDPKGLALMVGIALQVNNDEKQSLLELPGIPQMLTREQHLLSREILITRHMVDTQPAIEKLGFGPTGYAFPN